MNGSGGPLVVDRWRQAACGIVRHRYNGSGWRNGREQSNQM